MAIDSAEATNTKTIATEQTTVAGEPQSPDRTEATTIRKTPFSTPATSSTIPSVPTLTSEQGSKYTDLLQSVRTWAAEQNLKDHEQRWLTRECLLRYLRASSWNTATARKRLEATLDWRRSYGVDTKLTPDYISIENETGKQWIIGYDIAGRPCLYLNPQYQNTPKSDRQIEHLVFMMERCLDLTPPGQESLAILMNFAETRTGQGATIAQGRQTLNILQNHYPERLGRAILINLPWHISGFMKIILPFVDPVTKSKIIINQPMADHVPVEQLPVSHGGELQFEYEHKTFWPALTQLAAKRREEQFERWVRGGKQIGELEGYLKGGLDVGIGSEDKKAGTEKDVQAGEENGATEHTSVTGNVSEGAAHEIDGMTEKIVERDGETFEDAVEGVEELAI